VRVIVRIYGREYWSNYRFDSHTSSGESGSRGWAGAVGADLGREVLSAVAVAGIGSADILGGRKQSQTGWVLIEGKIEAVSHV
jgi:hypothetical protein